MENGEVTVSFDDVDLDACLERGFEFTGFTKCSHCNQVYGLHIHVIKKVQVADHPTRKKSKKVSDYAVTIAFSRASHNADLPELEGEPAESYPEEECVPCNGCTPNCPKKQR